MQKILAQTAAVVDELLITAENLQEQDIIVIGCSTSEISGKRIGTSSSREIAAAVMSEVLPRVRNAGLFLAVQCCEHLNRALVVERECMKHYNLTQVWVKPQLHAGGAFAMEAMEAFHDFVIVEDVGAKAAAGIDIGGTIIGMHLRPVAVPVRSQNRNIGEAPVITARTRPKYIGGPRAQYDDPPKY